MTTETLAGAVPVTRATTIRRVIAVALGAAFVAVAAQFEVLTPFSPVPETLQGGALLLVGLVLGPRLGAAALVTYLAAGVAGLPVFAGGGFGFIKIIGPTGGYLLAFPLGAFLAGYVSQNATMLMPPLRYLAGAIAGMAAVHLGGWAWLSVVTGDAGAAFAMGIVPFGISDSTELALAAAIAYGVTGRVRKLL
jgi:biotin transport system substrate-specific component